MYFRHDMVLMQLILTLQLGVGMMISYIPMPKVVIIMVVFLSHYCH